jgi:hypothetical protein
MPAQAPNRGHRLAAYPQCWADMHTEDGRRLGDRGARGGPRKKEAIGPEATPACANNLQPNGHEQRDTGRGNVQKDDRQKEGAAADLGRQPEGDGGRGHRSERL